MKIISFYCCCLLIVGSARADIVTVGTEIVGNKINLTSIELTTSSTLPNRVATWSQLIKAQVTDYVSVVENNTTNTVSVLATTDLLPLSTAQRLELIRDQALNTGIINPDFAAPGITIRFDQPIVNRRGNDIILFDLSIGVGQAPDPFLIYSADGRGNSRSYTSAEYEFTGLIPAAQLPFVYVLDAGNGGSIDFGELTNATLLTSSAITNPKFNGISINLSALGIPIDESVDSLVIQSIGNNVTAIDLLMIVGMPDIYTVPEPSSYAVVFIAVTAMLWLVLQGRDSQSHNTPPHAYAAGDLAGGSAREF